MARKRRIGRIAGQFAPRMIEMLESPGYRVLGLSARRVIDRIEVELAHHGGRDNGKLPVTFADFEHYGIHREAIGPAIREAVALRFVEVTRAGRGGNSEFRVPNLFRLTFRHTEREDPTHDWRRITTTEQAVKLVRRARGRTVTNVHEKQNPTPGNRTEEGTESVPKPRYGIRTTVSGTDSVPLSIFRGGGYRAGSVSEPAQEPPWPIPSSDSTDPDDQQVLRLLAAVNEQRRK
jgi:hypothetical protein